MAICILYACHKLGTFPESQKFEIVLRHLSHQISFRASHYFGHRITFSHLLFFELIHVPTFFSVLFVTTAILKVCSVCTDTNLVLFSNAFRIVSKYNRVPIVGILKYFFYFPQIAIYLFFLSLQSKLSRCCKMLWNTICPTGSH